MSGTYPGYVTIHLTNEGELGDALLSVSMPKLEPASAVETIGLSDDLPVDGFDSVSFQLSLQRDAASQRWSGQVSITGVVDGDCDIPEGTSELVMVCVGESTLLLEGSLGESSSEPEEV